MKTNHRRKKPVGESFDYRNKMYQTQVAHGLGYSDHDGGRRGSAKDVREAKTHEVRKTRRKHDRDLKKELTSD